MPTNIHVEVEYANPFNQDQPGLPLIVSLVESPSGNVYVVVGMNGVKHEFASVNVTRDYLKIMDAKIARKAAAQIARGATEESQNHV